METILFLAHTEADGSLGKAALEALSAAKALASDLAGSTLIAGLVGGDVQVGVNQISGCGAARFVAVAGPDFVPSRYSTDLVAATALCAAARATIVVAPATSRWNRVLAGVAQRLGARIDTHVTGAAVADGQPAITRWYYRQRMEAVVQRARRPWFILLDPGCGEPWSGAAGTAAVELVSAVLADTDRRTTVAGIQAPPADQQTIRPDAKLLFVAGAGWTKTQPDGKAHPEEAEKLILGFLANTKASLGSTKSLVDLSGEGHAVLKFMTHLNQVGQTGSTPRHPQRPFNLLPWRGTTHRRLAVYHRAPRDQPEPQLQLGPGQGRCALRGRRLRGDAQGQRVAGGADLSWDSPRSASG